MSDITKWTNMCESVLAFTCIRLNAAKEAKEIPTSICWTFKVDIITNTLIILPSLYQVKLYYQYYGGEIFNSRQRILYLCIFTSILTCLAFSIVNTIAVSQISFIVNQTLYWHILGYFILKVKALSRGGWITCLRSMYWIFIALFVYYTVVFVVKPIASDYRYCPGLIESEHWIIKTIILVGLIGLYVFASCILQKLLSNESDTLLDKEVRVERNKQFYKLKVILIITGLSESARLVGTLFTNMFSSNAQDCYIIDGENTEALSIFLILSYRIMAFYIPIIGVLWMLWIGKDKISLSFTDYYVEDDFNYGSRFASKLAYQGVNSRTKSNNMSNEKKKIDDESDDEKD